ncbi:MAG: hypothetical protein ACD_39C00527G0001, partial [uncultured bacterium]
MKSLKLILWILLLSASLLTSGDVLLAQSSAAVFGEQPVTISEDSATTGAQSAAQEGSGKGSQTGTVVVSPALNVRNGPWGAIIGSLYNG